MPIGSGGSSSYNSPRLCRLSARCLSSQRSLEAGDAPPGGLTAVRVAKCS